MRIEVLREATKPAKGPLHLSSPEIASSQVLPGLSFEAPLSIINPEHPTNILQAAPAAFPGSRKISLVEQAFNKTKSLAGIAAVSRGSERFRPRRGRRPRCSHGNLLTDSGHQCNRRASGSIISIPKKAA